MSAKPLRPGTRVRVYRTHNAAPHWFHDPLTGKLADPPAFSVQAWVWGVVISAEPAGDTCYYDIAITQDGRNLCLPRTPQVWVKRWWERAPRYYGNHKPRNIKRPVRKESV